MTSLTNEQNWCSPLPPDLYKVVAAFNKIVQQSTCGQPLYTYYTSGPLESISWKCIVSFMDLSGTGSDSKKRNAKNLAIYDWMQKHSKPKIDQAQINVFSALSRCLCLHPNMDSAHQDETGQTTTDIEQQGNTIITTAHGQSDTIVATTGNDHLGHIAGGLHTFPYLTDRYLVLQNVLDWTTKHTPGAVIARYYLPFHALEKNQQTPVAALFRQFLLSRPHMTVRVLVNATKFHSGTLVVGVRYNTSGTDDNSIQTSRQIQQMNCAYIQASSSNDAVLEIDYMHPFDFLPNNDIVACNGLYYAELFIGVVNQLGIGDTGSTTVAVKPMVRFSTRNNQTQFAFLQTHVDLQLVPNMMAALNTVGTAVQGVTTICKGVENVYKEAVHFFSDKTKTEDEDRPLVPYDRSTTVLQPGIDFSLGNGPMDAVSLRLSKDARTPHSAAKLPIVDHQFNFSYISSIFCGFLNFDWSVTSNPMAELATIQVTPIQVDAKSITGSVLYPPISELASYYRFWSGSLKLKFLFGTSQMHSGRLVLLFCQHEKQEISDTNWTAFPYVIFDIQEQQVFEYEIPMIQLNNLKPTFWRRDMSNQVYIYNYGVIKVLVLNPLRQIDSIASVVNVEVQIAGSPTFDLHVPRTSFVRSYQTGVIDLEPNMENRTLDVPILDPMPIASMPEVTIGEKFTLAASCRRMQLVASKDYALDTGLYVVKFNVNAGRPLPRKAGDLLDVVSAMSDGFRFFKGSMIYTVVITAMKRISAYVQHQPSDEELVDDMEVENYNVTDQYNIQNYAIQPLVPSYNPIMTVSVPWYSPTNMLANGRVSYTKTGSFTPYYANNGLLHILVDVLAPATVFDITIFRGLGDDAEMFCFQGFPPRLPTSNLNTLNVFGLQDNRPKPEIPVQPTIVLYLVDDAKMEPNPPPINIDRPIWIHHYNAALESWTAPVPYTNGKYPESQFPANDTLVFSLSVIRPRVGPRADTIYYDPDNTAGGEFQFSTWRRKHGTTDKYVEVLRDSGSTTYMSNVGDLCVGLKNKTNIQEISNVIPNIEDVELSCQPPKPTFAMINSILKKHDSDFRIRKSWMSDKYVVSKARSHLSRFLSQEKQLIFQEGEVLVENMERVRSVRSTLTGLVRDTISAPANIARASRSVSEAGERLSNILNDVNATANGDINNIAWFKTILDTISTTVTNSVVGVFYDIKIMIANCVVHVFNMFASSETRIKISSFIGLLISLNVLFSDKLCMAYECIKRLLFSQRTLTPNVGGSDFNRDETMDIGLSWFSLLLPMLTSALGFPATYAKMGMGAFHNYFRETIRLSNDISLFCSRNFEFVRKYAYWLVGRTNPHIQNVAIIKEKQEEMRAWAKEVLEITQGHVRDRIFSSCGMQKHVDLLFQQGSSYVDVIRDRNLSSAAFDKVFARISRLHYDLGQRVGRGNLVKEPVVLWLYGGSGVGKSNVAKKLAGDWLVHRGVSYDGDFCFIRNATRYWNGWSDQPCVVYDDAFQNRSADALSQEVTELFSICSAAEYNPEMPNLEDKNRLVNPDIVVYCSNVSHPVVNAVQSKEALWRRRDLLIEVAIADFLTNQGIRDANDPRITIEQLENFEHLKFRILNSTDTAQSNLSWMSFNRMQETMANKFDFLADRRLASARSRQRQGLMLSAEAYAQRLSEGDMQGAAHVVASSLNIPTLTQAINRFQRGGISDNDSTSDTGDSLDEDSDDEGSYTSFEPNCEVCDLQMNDSSIVRCLPLPAQDDNPQCYCELFVQFAEYCDQREAMMLNVQHLRSLNDASLAVLTRNNPRLAHILPDLGVLSRPPFSTSHLYYVMKPCEHCSTNCLTQNLRDRWQRFVEMEARRQSWSQAQIDAVASRYWYSNITAQQRTLAERAQRIADEQLELALTDFEEELETNISESSSESDIGEDATDTEVIRPVQRVAAQTVSRSTSVWNYLKKAACVIIMFSTILVLLYVLYRQIKVMYNLLRSKATFSEYFLTNMASNVIYHLGLGTFMKCYTTLIANIQSSGDVKTARIVRNPLLIVRTTSSTVVPNIDNDPSDVEDMGPTVTCALDLKVNQNKAELNKRIALNTVTLRIYADIPTPIKRKVGELDEVECKRTRLLQGNIFMFSGRYGLCPFHYARFFSQQVEKYPQAYVRLAIRTDQNRETEIKLSLEDLVFTRIGDLDLAWIKFPVRVPSFKRVLGQVATEADHRRFMKNARIVNGRDLVENVPTFVQTTVERVQAKTTYKDQDEQDYLLGYSYPWAGTGRCSALLVDDKRDLIMGLHVAGSSDATVGYSVVLERDVLAKIAKTDYEEVAEVNKDVLDETSEPILVPNGEVTIIGKVKQQYALRPVVKTQIRPSKACGLISPPTRFPVEARTPGEVSPGYHKLKIGVEKQLNAPEPFPKKVVGRAGLHLIDKIVQIARPQFKPVAVRSIDEAVCGVEGVPFMEPLKLGTSAGWPLCQNTNMSTKQSYVTVNWDTREVALHSEVKYLYDVNHALRINKIVPFTVYADFGKDERLKPGKDMRLINGSPLDHTIEWRRYAMDALSAIQSAQLQIGSAIGINPYGYGFDFVAKKLLEKGEYVITGDYANFGPTIQPEFVDIIRDLVISWYKEYVPKDFSNDHYNVLHCLFREVQHCIHIAGDCLYRDMCGIPSGNPFTAIFNTLANLLYLYCSWLLIFENTGLSTLSAFEKQVYAVCYGDDFVGSTNSVIAKMWNTATISLCFAKYGIKFTDASKSSVVKPFTKLIEAEFLKNTFRLHPSRNIYVACLRKEVIEDIFNWIREPCTDENEQLTDLSKQIARFASLHGPDYFRLVVSRLKGWFKSEHLYVPIPSWDYFDSLFDSGVELPWIDEDLF